MPRGPRLDAPGTVHHVWSRGIERRVIFLEDADRSDFVDRLERVLGPTNTRCFAWCLMDNHVHLVLQTHEEPLPRILHRVKTGFAVRFNRRHERSGHLFQNRYDSRPVADDADLMNLIRYVHLNPVRGGQVDGTEALEQHPWCGHAALMGRRAAHGFESVGAALALFAPDPDAARARLGSWMEQPLEGATPRSPIADASGLLELVEHVASRVGVDGAELRSGRKGKHLSRARAVVCHLAVTELGLLVRDVARELHLSAAGASMAARRGREIVRGNEVNKLSMSPK